MRYMYLFIYLSIIYGIGALPSTLLHLRSPTMYSKDIVKASLTNGTHMSYSAGLYSPNLASIKSMVSPTSNPIYGISIVFVDNSVIEASQIATLSSALLSYPTLLVASFDDPDSPFLKQKLDAGLDGVMLHSVESIHDIERLLGRVFFPPIGRRPVGPSPASSYLSDVAEEVSRANSVILGVASIGTKSGVENIESIVQAKQRHLLDLLLVDKYGLKRAYHDSGSVQAAIQRIENAARSVGLSLGYISEKDEDIDVQKLYDKGYRNILLGSEMDAVNKAFENFNDMPINPKIEPPIDSFNVSGNQLLNYIQANMLANIGFLMSFDVDLALLLSRNTNGIWIDGEHGTFSLSEITYLIQYFQNMTNVVVRVGRYNHPWIDTILKLGVKGLVVPSVYSADEAKIFVEKVRNYPGTMAIVMIETKEASAPTTLSDILSTRPDVIHLGPYDLALSLGVGFDSQLFKETIARIKKTVISQNIPLGGFAAVRSAAYSQYKEGFRFLTTVSDQEAITKFFIGYFNKFSVGQLQIMTKNQLDPLNRYVNSIAFIDTALPWIQRDNTSFVKVYSYSDFCTIQIVDKPGTAIIGKSYEQSHIEGQITMILKGQSRIEIGGVVADLNEGDTVFIPPGVPHKFTDMSTILRVVDVVLPRGSA